jgi:hypothetical protein
LARDGRFVGHAVDASDPARVRYQQGTISDRLRVGEQTLSVPPGRAREARKLIALGRLRRLRAGRELLTLPLESDRYLTEHGELVRELLTTLIAPPDQLIALVGLGDDPGVSALGAEVAEEHYFVLGCEKAWLSALGELGDVRHEELDSSSLRFEVTPDGPVITCGKRSRAVPNKRKSLIGELCELAALPPAERLGEGARRLHVTSRAPRARTLLAEARRRGYPEGAIIEIALELEARGKVFDREDYAARVAELRDAGISAEQLSETFRRWQFAPSLGRELIVGLALLGNDAEPWSLALHRSLRAQLMSDAKSPDQDLTRWDVELAEHELSVGENSRARSLAEARLRSLGPDEDALEAPPQDSQLRVARLRLYEVLCREARSRGNADVPALSALARLEPLSEPRLRALSQATSDDEGERRLIARAARVLSYLAPGGLTGNGASASNDSSGAFERSTLEQRLRHPLARGGGRLAARLSELVAAVPEPDLGFLRDFCEELSETRHAEAARALARATRLLSLPRVSAYVSHGARSVGLRAFGSSEPFVLIGERHLTPDDSYFLRGTELDFALGAELAHLAFGHQRVTSGEVWAGAAGKTKDALAALGLVLPVVVDLGGPRVQRILGRLGSEAFERATRGALRLPELFAERGASGSAEPLSQRNEELILAHRLVQLSADRAGLAIAQDLGGALRAMLLTRTDYRDLVDAAAKSGLSQALKARESHSLAVQDLMLRVRAIIAFYLSPEFDPFAGDAS